MTDSKRRIYTVSRLNQDVQGALESGFGMLWLQGELSNFSKPASGHFYFSLKDSQSQIRCAMFKGRNRYVDFKPQSGDEVLVRGKLGLYAARGDFQLIVEHMEPAGTGKLQMQFDATKQKLFELGWFNQEAKKALPTMPQRIGVVTSATGAALQDVLKVLARRCPQALIIVYPTLVQGPTAAPKIAKAIETADQRQEVDVLLLVRGGGSMEDLWAFNEESVAKAVFECAIPIVSGVGHEVDVTICDFVADLRAPTPSAAAEMATQDDENMIQRIQAAHTALRRMVTAKLNAQQTQLATLEERLAMRHPQRLLQDQGQKIDDLESRLLQTMSSATNKHQLQLSNLLNRLQSHSPNQQLNRLTTSLSNLNFRLEGAMEKQLTGSKNRWALASRALNTVSPLATLDRGFAVVKHENKVISKSTDVAVGDRISTQLAKGLVHSTVDEIE